MAADQRTGSPPSGDTVRVTRVVSPLLAAVTERWPEALLPSPVTLMTSTETSGPLSLVKSLPGRVLAFPAFS